MTDVLNIWLRGEHLGTVQQLRTGRTRLRFSDAAVQRWGVGTRLLDEAVRWGLSRRQAEDVVAETVEGVRGGLERVPMNALVESIADRVVSRAAALL